MSKIEVTAPVRIDISGGWPDSDPYRKDFGGVVLNAAINCRVSAIFDGDNLTTSMEGIPKNSGLGTSGAIRSAYLAASNPSLLSNRMDLIRRVHLFENGVLNHRAGFQDQAAAIYGGVNFFEFMSNGAIRRIEIPKQSADKLEKNLVLVYTGQTHLSANIHDLVFGPENYERTIPLLDEMKLLTQRMKTSLLETDEFDPALIQKTWDLQRRLHPSIETDCMKDLQEKFRSYYSAFRATGAGGGGCVLFYTEDPDTRSYLLAGLTELESKGTYPELRVIPFKFEYEGIKIN